MSATFIFAFLTCITLFSAPVFGGDPPFLHFPLQTQLPPVARVNVSFIWTLLPDTYLSGTALSYSAQDMPEWLSFNANTLTFTGVPTLDDVGSNYVIVQANASDSSVGTQSGFHCLVSTNPAPVVNASVSSQLSDGIAVFSSSYLISDSTIRIPPAWSFSIGFQYYTFTDPDGADIFYSSYRTDTTTLPGWLTFDNTTVTYGGQAPASDNGFDIELCGSDNYGYADVCQTFSIIIGSHSLVLSQPLPSINATAKEQISYSIPISGLTLDGVSISAGNLTNVTVNLENNTYLSYDSTSRIISGALPSELPSTNDIYIPVYFTDTFNDTVVGNVTLHIIPQLFSNGTLTTYNITGGHAFTDDLSSSLISSDSSYTAIFTPSNASSWLKFNNATKQISGTPPTLGGESVFVNLTGQDARTGITESAGLSLFYTDAPSKAQQTPTPLPSSRPSNGHGLSNGAKIAIAVVFGILGGLILTAIILWLCRRYCAAADDHMVDDEATYAAAAAAAEKGKGRATPMSNARLSTSSSESDRLSQAIAAAELSVAAALAVETGKPKRMDLLNLFGGAKRSTSSANNMASTQSGRSIKEILGLAPSRTDAVQGTTPNQPRRHDIIVVTDGDGYTYRPGSADGSASAAGEHDARLRSEGTRSSFDSHQSSSLFYSEESGSNNDSPVQRPRLVQTRESSGAPPQSVPRQRRDFLPYQPPPFKQTTAPIPMFITSSPPSRMPPGGIRLVQPFRDSGMSITDSDEAYHADPEVVNNAGLAADAAIATAHLEQLSSAASLHSHDSRPITRPRLIPFTSERRGERSDSLPQQRFASQKGIAAATRSAENSMADEFAMLNDSTEDADEDRNPNRFSHLSAPYFPPPEGETSSPIFFNDAVHPGNRPSQSRGDMSVNSGSVSVESATSRTMASSSTLDPLRMQVRRYQSRVSICSLTLQSAT